MYIVHDLFLLGINSYFNDHIMMHDHISFPGGQSHQKAVGAELHPVLEVLAEEASLIS